MPSPALILGLLLAAAFAFATHLQPWFAAAASKSDLQDSLAEAVLSDSRSLFASQFFTEADVYYHMGYYPSMFDRREQQGVHMAGDAGLQKEGEEFGSFGQPHDWLENFGRNFYPSRHEHADTSRAGGEREILPWLWLAAELDPHRVETFTVAAFWLRKGLHQPEEAERFLREGLRANPGDPQILFELGRLYLDDKNDLVRARNVQELAWRKWHERLSPAAEPDDFLRQQILGQLALIEQKDSHWAKAIEYLEKLKEHSPAQKALQAEIDELRKKIAPPK